MSRDPRGHVSPFGRNPRLVLRDLLKLDYALCEKSFIQFYRAAWNVLEPGNPLLFNWHLEVIAEYLEATLTGEIKRLIVNVPPRSSKSIEVTVAFPAWCWIKDPGLRFIGASYAEDLATKHNVDRRLLMLSDWYQAAWGDRFAFSADQNQKAEYTNDRRGHCIGVGMLGAVTGKGGDYVIIDDPHNPKKAESELERASAIGAFDSAFTTRLDNKKTGRIIVVMQRLHPKDLTGHLIEKGGYTLLKLPAEAPVRTIVRYPVSGRVKVRQAGDILHAEREGPAELETAKRDLGSYNYAGQYGQDPTPRTGGLFKAAYWRYYDPAKLPASFDELIQTWDLTFKDAEQAKSEKGPDFAVGLVLGRKGADVYVLDMERGQWGLTASKAAVRRLTTKWPRALSKLVEAKANGPGLVDDLKKEIPGLILVEVDGSKWERACLCEPMLEAGNVYLPLPEKAPWIHVLIDESAKFPRGDRDDTVDALTQGLNRLRLKASGRTAALGKL